MTETTNASDAPRAVWASGDYDACADLIWDVGPRIVRRLGVAPGEDVLDVACGTGNAAIRAAQAGARVVGVDVTPELFTAGRRRAAQAGVEIEWVAGNVQQLPFPDASFDVVVSIFGAMFAPDHEAAAAELSRVLRPGGRLGLCSWTPEGNIGAFFRLFAAQLPPQPGPAPTRWGSVGHIRGIFAGTGVQFEFERQHVVLRRDSIADAVELYETKFGPVLSARRQLEPTGRWPEVRADLETLFRLHNQSGDGTLAFPAEYLTAVGRRRHAGQGRERSAM